MANVKALLRAGADVNFVSTIIQSTPLMIAVNTAQYDIACELLLAGADPRLGNDWVLQVVADTSGVMAIQPEDARQKVWKQHFVRLLEERGFGSARKQ
jgi:hypothetical protein